MRIVARGCDCAKARERAMAGVSRRMARSFASTATAAGRFCGSKGAPARGGLGAAAPRSAPSSSFSSPRSFFMESRRPGAFFGRWALVSNAHFDVTCLS